MKLEDLLKGSVEPTKLPIAQVEPPKVEIPDYLLNDPQVVGYPDLEMQNQIYGMIARAIYNSTDDVELRTGPYSVKDFGAGRGDIKTWLIPDDIVYTGYETNRLLVEAGKVKYDGINLVEMDFMQSTLKTDFTICVGTLNSMPTNDKWKLFREVMQKALETTTNKIIFVLANRFDVEGYNDFPLTELVQHLPTNPFELNYAFLEDIYMLVVHADEFKP